MNRRVARLRSVAIAPIHAFLAWQAEIPDEGRIVVVGLLILGAGLALVWPPAALVVPGALLAAVGLGLNLRHPITAGIAIGAVAAVVVTALVMS